MAPSFTVGEWTVEPDLNTISSNGTTNHLEPKTMEVLVRLAGSPNQTLSKDELIKSVWPDTFVGDDVLSRSVYELRKAFGDDPHEPKIIQTIPKRGYRLIAQVRRPQQEPLHRHILRRPAAISTALVLLALVVVFGYRWGRHKRLTRRLAFCTLRHTVGTLHPLERSNKDEV